MRELENTCERMAESCTCGQVRLGCVGASVLFHESRLELAPARDAAADPAIGSVLPAWDPRTGGPLDAPAGREDRPAQLGGLSLDEYLRRVEAECIASALSANGGNKSRAARLLGIKRSTLGDRIVRCGLERAAV